MKKQLTKVKNELYHFVYGEKINGNCTGLSGDCYGLSGDLDSCDISDEERKNGVNINDLIND